MKERVNLSDFARANNISPTKRYQMAHSKKYSGIIQKFDGIFKVDIERLEALLEYEEQQGYVIPMHVSFLDIYYGRSRKNKLRRCV